MVRKAKVERKPRETLSDKLKREFNNGYARGFEDGKIGVRAAMGPTPHLKAGVSEFVAAIGAWPLDDEGLVALSATDLKRHATMAVQVRFLKAVAKELARLGY